MMHDSFPSFINQILTLQSVAPSHTTGVLVGFVRLVDIRHVYGG